MLKTRLLIKELGNDGTDGHFVLGFSDGNGPEISKMEITNFVLDTVGKKQDDDSGNDLKVEELVL